MTMYRIFRKVESARVLDRVTGPGSRAVRKLLDGTAADRVLRGAWWGHPVHPALVAVPIGAWLSSAALDASGQRDAARHLVALGLVATVPAVVTGVAEVSMLPAPSRRVGVFHAASNVIAASCYLISHRRRSAGAHGAGVAWGVLGLVAVGAGGALGGHLTYALGAGVSEGQGELRPGH